MTDNQYHSRRIFLWAMLFALLLGANAAAQSPGLLYLQQQQKAEASSADKATEKPSRESGKVGAVSEEGPANEKKNEGRLLVRAFLAAHSTAERLGQRARFLVSGIEAAPGELKAAADNLLKDQKPDYLYETTLPVLLIVLFGILCQYLVGLRMRDLYDKAATVPPSGVFNKMWRVLLRFSLDLLLALVYVFATFAAFLFAYEQNTFPYFFAAVVLLFTYYMKAIAILLRTLFSPGAPALRLAPLQDSDAGSLSNWIMASASTAIAIGGAAALFRKLGVGDAVYLVLYNVAGAAVVLLTVFMIWSGRRRVTRLIRENWLSRQANVTPLAEKMAEIWYFPAILYTLAIGFFWEIGILLEEDNLVNRLIASFLCAPLYILADQWGQKLLSLSFQRSTIPLSEEPEKPAEAAVEIEKAVAAPSAAEKPEPEPDDSEENGWDDDKRRPVFDARVFMPQSYLERNLPFVRKLFRIMLAGLVFFSVLRLWGVDWTLGRAFTQAAVGILISLVLAYLAWEFARSYIDRKLEEERFFDREDMEEGGAGGSRIGTLLFLLRKFVMIMLVLITAMTVLSSLGVDIGPLIAGAGIVGIAIGFGSQTLVKDIISGIFFLIDDAFRVGDYVDAGGLKGMVEQISIRSLRLRHHRGPVHTIPFSSLKQVTNMSRDYIIEKLNFRVRYDTDVDKVRKIVKKIDQEISKDPEIGHKLLDRIKSQGVRELDDSAMIMRVKFKCIPGEQFIIRREVFRLLQEKFKQAGIEFAHKNVTVYLPPDESRGSGNGPAKLDERIARAAGAAALSAEQEEQQAQNLKDTAA